GNGDNFIFDMGAGSHERLASLDIPYDRLDKIFLGHLHMDHMGDLPAFYFTGPANGRLSKLRVWGPSGVRKEWGIRSCLEYMRQMFAWEEMTSRLGDARGLELDVNEFDWTAVHKVIYDENGVVARSLPAVHLDQSASFILEWQGLRFAFSSDTMPNKWWVEHTKKVDIAIHECALPAELMIQKTGRAAEEALLLVT